MIYTYKYIYICIILMFEKELEEIKSQKRSCLQNIQVDDSNILQWTGLIVPVSI